MLFYQHSQHIAQTETLPCVIYPNNDSTGLFVFLHGAGEKGMSPAELHTTACAEICRTHALGYDILMPCCPNKHASWPTALVLDCILTIAEEREASHNIIIAGSSMGGRGVYELLYEHAAHFHAAIVIAGHGIPNLAPHFQSTPLWIAHARNDAVVPFERARDMAKILTHSQTQWFDDAGHNCLSNCFEETRLWTWLKTSTS